jgi:hypothetical protein
MVLTVRRQTLKKKDIVKNNWSVTVTDKSNAENHGVL